MSNFFKVLFLGLVFFAGSFSVDAQMKRRASAAPGEGIETSENILPQPAKTPTKKNDRPDTGNNSTPKTPAPQSDSAKGATYKYEFSQPNFIVKKIILVHDETGKGTITFEKKNAEEPITDPIQLSPVSVEKINNLMNTLNFLDSAEDYQSPMRDYGHLGNYQITLKKDGKERTVKYNWSENTTARELSGEYRKIGEQAVWLFDMSVALENQPLEAPSLMDRLDSLLKRNEISDPPQLLPVLKNFSNDERLPLMARNHATRIIKEIEKKESGNK